MKKYIRNGKQINVRKLKTKKYTRNINKESLKK